MAYIFVRFSKFVRFAYILFCLSVLYICFDIDSFRLEKRLDDVGSRWRSAVGLADGSSADRGPRTKRVLLFGMKPHWVTFCNFARMYLFKHLVQFPRSIACPSLNVTISLSFSVKPNDIAGQDLVVFTNVYHWLTVDAWAWALGNRSEGQQWVMVSLDSPVYTAGLTPPVQFSDRTYNWLASYKTDSDVLLSYGSYEPFSDGHVSDDNLQIFFTSKTELVAWVGSNCETAQWDRLKLVRDIAKITKLDTFGKCGQRKIPWNDEQVLGDVLGKYKFYLSFESSCCDDYITEKFWRALHVGIVPVVVGATYEQYSKVAPPNSFIHVEQFESLADLVAHLLELSLAEEKYLEYFKWRNLGTIKFTSQEEQYVRPLADDTHCSMIQNYMQEDGSTGDRYVSYFSQKWGNSCKRCGTKWIQEYMKQE